MLPAPEFVLFLPHENSSRRIGMHLVRAGHRRHIRPPAAYHAVPVAIGGLLGAFFAPALRLAARTPLFRRVCTELPRKSRHTAPCQDHFPDAHVGDDALLHFLAAYRLVVAALLAVAIGVTWHILSFATLKKGVLVQEDPEGE